MLLVVLTTAVLVKMDHAIGGVDGRGATTGQCHMIEVTRR